MKTNKILSIILAIAMTMSTMSFNVFANEEPISIVDETPQDIADDNIDYQLEFTSEDGTGEPMLAAAAPVELYVNCDYTSETEGFGTSKFNSYASAYSYATTNAKTSTIVIEKTTTVSGNCFDNNHKNYSRISVVASDGALIGNSSSKWDMTYGVTLKPGAVLQSARPKNASIGNSHIKNTLTVGEAGSDKKAVIDFHKGTYQDMSIAVLYNGMLIANNALVKVGDLGLTGSGTFNDSTIDVKGIAAFGKNNWYKHSMTNTTMNVKGHNLMNEDKYYSTTGTLINNLTMDNSSIVVDDGVADTIAEKVTIKSLAMQNGSSIKVEKGTPVALNGKATLTSSKLNVGKFDIENDGKLIIENEAVATLGEDGDASVNADEINVKTGGEITVGLGSKINADKLSGDGTIIIDATGFDYKSFDVFPLDIAASVFSGKFDVTNEPGKELVVTKDTAGDLVLALPVAKIGDVNYSSIQAAIAAADDGDTITLLEDVTIDKPVAFTKALTLDLDGNTLNMTAETSDVFYKECKTAYYVDAPLTIKNGNVNVSSTDANYVVHGLFFVSEAADLAFDNVNLVSNGYSAFTMFYLYGGLAFNESNVDVIAAANSERFVYSENYQKLTINDSAVTATGLTWHGGEFVEFDVSDNSVVTLDGAKSDIYLGNLGTVKGADKLPVVDTTSVLNAEIYLVPEVDADGTTNFAETIKLTYEPTDKQNVYNIYVESADAGKTINRLSAIQLKFKLESDTNMSYTLAPAKGVALTNAIDESGIDTKVEDVYVFNFTGENGVADKTGAKIQIGTVTFGGYGEFDFLVVASDGNYMAKAKTAEANDNIIAEYVPVVENAKQGLFDLNASALTGAEIVEARRNVVVNIDFNNNLKDAEANIAAYNQMKVTLTGSNGKTYESEVSADGETVTAYTNEQAVLIFSVEAGYRYTVTVSGAGYRTVRYTTLVDEENVELNFWNNALENADRTERTEEIEAGVARSAKSVTFLAGDISPDNTIDKYDLAAVVSYFGYDNLKSDAKYYGFAKYDLNRDGQIDADDIATVLISWGK